MKKILFSLVVMISSYFLTQAQDNIGVQLYSFRNQFKTDVPGTLAAIEKMGFKYIEGGDSYGMPIKDIKLLLDKSKFKVDPFKWLFTITSDNLAINVYNTNDRETIGAVISADNKSKKIFIKKGGMDDQYLNILFENIQSFAPHAEIEVKK